MIHYITRFSIRIAIFLGQVGSGQRDGLFTVSPSSSLDCQAVNNSPKLLGVERREEMAKPRKKLTRTNADSDAAETNRSSSKTTSRPVRQSTVESSENEDESDKGEKGEDESTKASPLPALRLVFFH